MVDSPSMNSSIRKGVSARLSETDHTPFLACKLDLRLRKASHQAFGALRHITLGEGQDQKTPVVPLSARTGDSGTLIWPSTAV
jgi:hypothetical protein